MAQPRLELSSSDFVPLNDYPVPVRYVPGSGPRTRPRLVREIEINKQTKLLLL